jgi:hypothetical protein
MEENNTGSKLLNALGAYCVRQFDFQLLRFFALRSEPNKISTHVHTNIPRDRLNWILLACTPRLIVANSSDAEQKKICAISVNTHEDVNTVVYYASETSVTTIF